MDMDDKTVAAPARPPTSDEIAAAVRSTQRSASMADVTLRSTLHDASQLCSKVAAFLDATRTQLRELEDFRGRVADTVGVPGCSLEHVLDAVRARIDAAAALAETARRAAAAVPAPWSSEPLDDAVTAMAVRLRVLEDIWARIRDAADADDPSDYDALEHVFRAIGDVTPAPDTATSWADVAAAMGNAVMAATRAGWDAVNQLEAARAAELDAIRSTLPTHDSCVGTTAGVALLVGRDAARGVALAAIRSAVGADPTDSDADVVTAVERLTERARVLVDIADTVGLDPDVDSATIFGVVKNVVSAADKAWINGAYGTTRLLDAIGESDDARRFSRRRETLSGPEQLAEYIETGRVPERWNTDVSVGRGRDGIREWRRVFSALHDAGRPVPAELAGVASAVTGIDTTDVERLEDYVDAVMDGRVKNIVSHDAVVSRHYGYARYTRRPAGWNIAGSALTWAQLSEAIGVWLRAAG